MILVQMVWLQPLLLLVMLHGTSVVVLLIVLLTLVSLKKKCTKNSVLLVRIILTGLSKKLDNVILLIKNVLLL
jgi:hypothetical protein